MICLRKWGFEFDPSGESTREEREIDDDLIEKLLGNLEGIVDGVKQEEGESSCLRKSELSRRHSVRRGGGKPSFVESIRPSRVR